MSTGDGDAPLLLGLTPRGPIRGSAFIAMLMDGCTIRTRARLAEAPGREAPGSADVASLRLDRALRAVTITCSPEKTATSTATTIALIHGSRTTAAPGSRPRGPLIKGLWTGPGSNGARGNSALGTSPAADLEGSAGAEAVDSVVAAADADRR